MFFPGVFAAEADGVEAVSATEGESVTLPTGVILRSKEDLIQWDFGPNCTATVSLLNVHVYDESCNDTFRDRLQFDQQTGSLTIRKPRTTDSGLYKLLTILNNIINKTSVYVSVKGEGGSLSIKTATTVSTLYEIKAYYHI